MSTSYSAGCSGDQGKKPWIFQPLTMSITTRWLRSVRVADSARKGLPS
jgi:hypothetical protein